MNSPIKIFIASIAVIVGGIALMYIVDLSLKSVPDKPQQVYVTLIIDGCEYIRIEPDGLSLCHKGNCTNSIHRYAY